MCQERRKEVIEIGGRRTKDKSNLDILSFLSTMRYLFLKRFTKTVSPLLVEVELLVELK
jgi:hypothetical protein